MKSIILSFVLADKNWVIVITLIAAVLAIIDSFTIQVFYSIIRYTLRIKHNGIIPSNFLKYKKKFDGEVFAIELLNEDIVIEKNRIGDNTILINRDSVKHALITNSGKKAMNIKFAQKFQQKNLNFENEVQDFLLKPYIPGDNRYVLSLNQMPLRWASGGVLSIVNYKKQKWIPMFFRDIPPFGWNISLGSTERSFIGKKPNYQKYECELNSPLNFIEREFLEETLVLSDFPIINERRKAKYFKSISGFLNDNTLLQIQNFNEHNELRNKYDEFSIFFDKGDYIAPRFHPSNMEVKVKKGNNEWNTRDVFICFNLLELGIEVVKIIEYDLTDNDYMLDGEVLEKNNIKELVRMPIALISLDYLEREFKIDTNDEYTVGIAPSVIALNKIKEDEVVLFDWDIKQRYNIISGRKNGIGSELERYIGWKDQFHENFKMETNGKISTSNLPRLFTPATIKIFKQYLNFQTK